MSYGSFALKAIPKPDVRQPLENYIDLWEERDLRIQSGDNGERERSGSIGQGAEPDP